jgi:hypothetical protein
MASPRQLLSLLLVCLASHSPAGELRHGQSVFGTGFPELSAASPAGPENQFVVVADNELPSLGLFRLSDLPAAIHAPALRSGISPEYAVDDIEGSTVFPWDINGDGSPEAIYHVFCASCARTKGKGKVEPQRDAIFALSINPAAPAGQAFPDPATVEYNRSLREQIRALGSSNPAAPWGPLLRNAVSRPGTNASAADATLAGADGLNIEGLTTSLDGSSLLLGLRSPLCRSRAILIPLVNPVALLGLGESQPQPAAPGQPILLDLGGLGIRSIERDTTSRIYWIAAGPAGPENGPFLLFTWNGDPDAPPTRIPVPESPAAEKLTFEAIAAAPQWPFVLAFADGGQKLPFFRGLAISRRP